MSQEYPLRRGSHALWTQLTVACFCVHGQNVSAIPAASSGHTFWPCPKLYSLWDFIFKCLTDSLGHMGEPDLVVSVFGALGQDRLQNKNSRSKCTHYLLEVWKFLDFKMQCDVDIRDRA